MDPALLYAIQRGKELNKVPENCKNDRSTALCAGTVIISRNNSTSLVKTESRTTSRTYSNDSNEMIGHNTAKMYRVLHAYDQTQLDELSIRPGDNLREIDGPFPEGGWVFVQNIATGLSGYVPGTYIEEQTQHISSTSIEPLSPNSALAEVMQKGIKFSFSSVGSEFNKDSKGVLVNSDDDSVMMVPDHIEEEENFSTKYLNETMTDSRRKALKKRKVYTKHDYNASFKWEALTDNSKFEQVETHQGGFGEVLILRAKKTGEKFVVKRNFKGDNAESNTTNEIRQMKKLKDKSKYVIEFIGISVYDKEKNLIAIIMEYGGLQLDKFLRDFLKEKQNTEELREILEDILLKTAIGINDIHKQDIMHRDIKEANVFVNESGGVFIPRISDFGTARNVKQFQMLEELVLREIQETMIMTRIGTVPYMAPEMDEDKPYDEKVDCFAWAKMAINCHKLCGFIDTKFITKIKSPGISNDLLAVIKECLKEDPEDRICSNIIVERLKKTSKIVGQTDVGQTNKSVIKPRPTLKPKPKINRCTALFSYEAEDIGELTIEKGDTIVISKMVENGWWTGTNERTKKSGDFPGNYVQMIS